MKTVTTIKRVDSIDISGLRDRNGVEGLAAILSMKLQDKEWCFCAAAGDGHGTLIHFYRKITYTEDEITSKINELEKTIATSGAALDKARVEADKLRDLRRKLT